MGKGAKKRNQLRHKFKKALLEKRNVLIFKCTNYMQYLK